MPELPEVEVTRRRLAPFVVGARVENVVAAKASYFFLTPPKTLVARLSGRTLRSLDRHGKHLIATLDISETRLCWQEKRYSSATREARGWKRVLNEVLDQVEGTALEWILDEFTIPVRDAADTGIDLRTWVGIRRAKDPQRIPSKEVAA